MLKPIDDERKELEYIKSERKKKIMDKDELLLQIGIEVGKIKNKFDELQNENKQSKDNWNKLKEYIKSEWTCFDNESVEFEVSQDILDKMQKLEEK
jgi:hypothetical protein